MENNETTYEIPDFGPDDDTEEMEPREYREAYQRSDIDFPDWDLLPEMPEEFQEKKKVA